MEVKQWYRISSCTCNAKLLCITELEIAAFEYFYDFDGFDTVEYDTVY